MIDGGLWRTLQPKLMVFGKVDRVENRTMKGMADVVYHLATPWNPIGTTGWLELKHLDDWPARDATPIRVGSLSKEQVLWQEDWEKAGGRVRTVLRVGKGASASLLFMRPAAVRELFEGRVNKNNLIDRCESILVGYAVRPILMVLVE